MQKDYFEEYRLFGLDAVAVTSVLPLVRFTNFTFIFFKVLRNSMILNVS